MSKFEINDLMKFKSLNVLYVEDNKEVRDATFLIFERLFNSVDIAIDGLDGLTRYKENDYSYYDLIISDISMPIMNGIEMVSKIFNINKEQNILMITAYNDPEYLQELINLGITKYIHKPLKLDNLIEVLQDIQVNIDKKKSNNDEFSKIKKLNKELDTLVESFDTYVIASRTDLTGKITYASKAYEAISGYKEEELLGKPHSIVRHPDMPKEAFIDMWETIQSGKLWVGDVKNLKKDGSYYWVKASIAPYYDADNNHIGYSAIRLDISAQKEVEDLNKEVNILLNSVSQGFLSFDKEMKVQKSFSKECLNIFNQDEIYKKDISELLFENDKNKKELFVDGISRIVSTDDNLMIEMFLSLLPKEHTLNGKDLEIEYKTCIDNKFVMVITDVTKQNSLKKHIQEQEEIQKMIVSVASDKSDFITLKLDFENFLSNPSNDLKKLLRELHTFKGVFAQKDMIHIVKGIHNLESKIKDIEDCDYEGALELFKNHDLESIFSLDLDIINSNLGDDFLDEIYSLNVSKEALEELELKIKDLSNQDNTKELLEFVDRFKYKSVYEMLSKYAIVVKNMSQNLDKEIYPLEVVGDKKLKVSPKFEPFMTSLIHLFNNCVDHGIEDIESRIKNEKSEIATITCEFLQVEDSLQIKISDDGRGIDIEKIVLSAVKKAIISENKAKNMGKDEKNFLVFADSLSTKDYVSTTSGRGVGMSVIYDEVKKLDGDIKIKNNLGNGVEFIFTLPIKKGLK